MPEDPRARSSAQTRDASKDPRQAAMYRRRRALVLFGISILGFIALSIAHRVQDSTHANGITVPTRPISYSVGMITCRFVDHSRATPDYENGTSIPGRVLLTEIRYPSLERSSGEIAGAPIARSDGPFPLVVFAHGYRLMPDNYTALLDAWVRSGLVVASPVFPDTNTAAVEADGNSSLNENDDVNQPGDVAFVIRQLLAASAAPIASCPRLDKVLHAEEVGVAGQSDGAETVAALEYDSSYRTTGLSVRATAVFSGEEFPGPTGASDPYLGAQGPALLVVQSATDACNPPQYSTKLYDDVHQSDKWFLALANAEHLPPYIGTDPSAFSLVSAVTTRFFDLELHVKSGSPSLAAVARGHASVGTLSTGAVAPALPSLEQVSAACYLGMTP